MARFFQELGEPVVLIDTDPESCRKAEAEGFRVFLSSGLDREVLESAGLDDLGTFLAMTSNGEVNLVLAQRAAEEFRPPRVLAVFPRDPETSTQTANAKVHQALMSHLPIKTWNQYLSEEQVKLGKTVLKEPGFTFQQAHLQALIRAGELVPLLVEREERWQIVSASEDWQEGDRIIYLLHDPRPKLLRRLSGVTPYSRLALEKLPEVEEIPIPTATAIDDSLANPSLEESAAALPLPPPVSS
jgi:Trk K+ transport system NAD-binding subunit